MLLALITGGAAAATGYADYREIPADTEEKRVANAHALLNAGVMASLVVQLLIRATGRVGLFARLLNIAASRRHVLGELVRDAPRVPPRRAG